MNLMYEKWCSSDHSSALCVHRGGIRGVQNACVLCALQFPILEQRTGTALNASRKFGFGQVYSNVSWLSGLCKSYLLGFAPTGACLQWRYSTASTKSPDFNRLSLVSRWPPSYLAVESETNRFAITLMELGHTIGVLLSLGYGGGPRSVHMPPTSPCHLRESELQTHR
ncbi:hypothetical protein GQ53DRAFT_302801 [Thozetella sp. PMI_491]|nr:hypothetical protein GQ53DRAFT_302801 [Thozetella sp. PMI_491]